jgi:hypothetical protein
MLQEYLHSMFLQFVAPAPWLNDLEETRRGGSDSSSNVLESLFLWAWDCVSSRSMYFNGPLGKVLLLPLPILNARDGD